MTPPFPSKKERADRVPGAFLLGSAHICWLTPHHRAALKPSEEAEALAPSVFNGGWLGHEKADAGGSGPTFLREHHENCSNKALTFTSKQTPETEQHWRAADLFIWHIITPCLTFLGSSEYITWITRSILQICLLAVVHLSIFIQNRMQRVWLSTCALASLEMLQRRRAESDGPWGPTEDRPHPLALLIPYCKNSPDLTGSSE